MSLNEQDVVVIGGGLAGLAAATFIARGGKTVHLLEQSHNLGGRARTSEQKGFYLNIGPHALYRGGRGMEILTELGIRPRGRVPSVSGAYAVLEGRKHTLPAGVVSLLTTSLFGLAAKMEMARLLASLPKIDHAQYMSMSIREWLDEKVTHDEVKDFLMALFRVATYANAPDIMSAGAAIEQLKLAFTKSVLYLDGGWQQLVDALAEAAAKAGVRIETSAKIETIERDQAGRVKAVRLGDGRVIEASTVVIAASPEIAARMIDNGKTTSLARFASEAVQVRAACLDVALKSLPKPKTTFAVGIDRPFYLSVHSATARLAPEGNALIHVAKYLAPNEAIAPETIKRELEGLLDLVQPGWRDLIVYNRFLPDMIVANAMPKAESGGMSGRPSPAVEDVPGLFIAGDWVGSEGLLADASLRSAKEAARLIVEQRAGSRAVAV